MSFSSRLHDVVVVWSFLNPSCAYFCSAFSAWRIFLVFFGRKSKGTYFLPSVYAAMVHQSVQNTRNVDLLMFVGDCTPPHQNGRVMSATCGTRFNPKHHSTTTIPLHSQAWVLFPCFRLLLGVVHSQDSRNVFPDNLSKAQEHFQFCPYEKHPDAHKIRLHHRQRNAPWSLQVLMLLLQTPSHNARNIEISTMKPILWGICSQW